MTFESNFLHGKAPPSSPRGCLAKIDAAFLLQWLLTSSNSQQLQMILLMLDVNDLSWQIISAVTRGRPSWKIYQQGVRYQIYPIQSYVPVLYIIHSVFCCNFLNVYHLFLCDAMVKVLNALVTAGRFNDNCSTSFQSNHKLDFYSSLKPNWIWKVSPEYFNLNG